MSQDNQRRQGAAPIGNDAPKSPADRVRQIQEMQRAMETQQVAPQRTQQAAQAQQTMATSQPVKVPDGFNVNQVQQVQQNLLTPKAKPADHAAYAQAQRGAQQLFGGSNDIELKGNPWKVISFNDSIGALFDLDGPAENFEAVVPEKAVQTEDGLLFEVGVKNKTEQKADAAVQKKAVLVDGQGRLAGAECKSGGDVERLFKNAPWLLPQNATQSGAKWAVTAGNDSAFLLRVDKGSGRGTTTELTPLNNFGLPLFSGPRERGDITVANYHLDRFDAGL